MKKHYITTVFILITCQMFGQHYDNTWLLGYGGGSLSPNEPHFGISTLTFDESPFPSIFNNQDSELNFNDTNTAMSDWNGDLLFYFNGILIYDASHKIMENGTEINEWEQTGQDVPQGGLVIPYPDNPNKYILFHEVSGVISGWGAAVLGLEYSVIDMTENDGLGAVILKKEPLITDSLDYGKLTATRHANGRDWWILVQELNTNNYYRILVSPEGVNVIGEQTIGEDVKTGFGEAVFSPDGNFYAKFNTISLFEGQYIHIYKFDRCTGLLSNHIQLHYNQSAYAGGISVSPNSRFLYVSSYDYIYQFDLWASDIIASQTTVAEYDDFIDLFPTRFYQMQLAPDGKIYISVPSSVWYLHEIQNPNKQGVECNVTQHSFKLPTLNGFSLPNFPNYRLGPIDGSPCDTLGIDNLPVAGFRSDNDTLNTLKVYFTNLSYYEPTDWFWTFGDNQSSTETEPNHIYPESGIYEVCLTVSNDFGSDTFCKEVEVGVTASSEIFEDKDFMIFPNPAQSFAKIITDQPVKSKTRFLLFNELGQSVLETSLNPGQREFEIDLSAVSKGIYFYKIQNEKKSLSEGKLVVVKS